MQHKDVAAPEWDSADNAKEADVHMTEAQVFSRIGREHHLFTLPEVLAQVLKAIDSPNSSMEVIAGVIARDVALTGKILMMANSSFYGRSGKVRSAREAVGVLGTRTVKSVALSVSVYDICNRLATRIDLRDFWRHSLEMAIVSELVAKAAKSGNQEEAFVCGLLLDIGIIVLDSAYPKDYEQVWTNVCNGGDINKCEEEALGTNHARVAAFLAEKWNLPQNYVESIRNHHTVFKLDEAGSVSKLSQVVGLSSRICKFSLYGPVYKSRDDFENRNVLMRNLCLAPDDLALIDSETVMRFVETAKFLDIDVGSSLDLVQRANYLLFDSYSQLELLYRRLDEEQGRVPASNVDEIAIEVLHIVVATFSHYFNNASATMLGRSQLLELAIRKGEIQDNPAGALAKSIEVIQRGVQNITNVLNVMKSVDTFRTVEYHESARIMDLKGHLNKISFEQLDPARQV